MTREKDQFLSTDITDWMYEADGWWRHKDGLFEVRRIEEFSADVVEFPDQELCDPFVEVYEIEGLDADPFRVTLVTAGGGQVAQPIPGYLRRVPSIDVHVARIVTPDPERLRMCLHEQGSLVSAAYALR